ncbi:hypothetical protein Taro_021629 [Colocasia esculenta]|uniref:SWIM-type domain-containing protein n=1 Tax=Colocasia esculenta TaxID=4460 RepID=A0A843V1R5_COLES|nr:hypothetical protein [Colocasia esculenta]
MIDLRFFRSSERLRTPLFVFSGDPRSFSPPRSTPTAAAAPPSSRTGLALCWQKKDSVGAGRPREKQMDDEKERTHYANDPEILNVNEDIEENDLSESSEDLRIDEDVDKISNVSMVNALMPKIGMTFETVDEAYQFYNYYAYRIGFGIAKTCSRRKDGVQHEYTFSCEKSGKPKGKKGLTLKRARISKKTGCQAKFRVRLNEDGLWHLAFLVLHHNHYCSPNGSHQYRSHRMMPFHVMPLDAQKQLIRNVQEEVLPDRFQKELQKCVDCTCFLIRKDGAVLTYEVKERVKQRTYIYEVLFNEKDVKVQCLCRGFEFGGILCSHAIVVLKEKDVHRIPTRYICTRWRKSFKDDYQVHISSDIVVPQPCERFDKLYLQCLQHLSKLVEMGASSDDRHEYLLKFLTKVGKKLAETGKSQKGKVLSFHDISNSISCLKSFFLYHNRDGLEKGEQNGSTSDSRVTEISGRIPPSSDLPNLPGGVQLINEMTTQGIVPYYLVSLGEQPTNNIISSILTSQAVVDLWGQRNDIFPNATQSSNQ